MAINRAEQNWPEEMINDLDGVVLEVVPVCPVLEEESESEMERRTR